MIYMSVLHNKGNVWGFIARCEQHDEFVLIKPEGQLISLLILSSLRGFVSEKYILPAPIKSQWSYCMWNHNVSTLNKACQNSWRKTKSGWNTDKKKGRLMFWNKMHEYLSSIVGRLVIASMVGWQLRWETKISPVPLPLFTQEQTIYSKTLHHDNS